MDINEKALLSILCQGGAEIYHDIVTCGINTGSFKSNTNGALFSCLEILFNDGISKPDKLMIISTAQDNNYSALAQDEDYIEELFEEQVEHSNAGPLAKRIQKIAIARSMQSSIKEAGFELSKVDGTESINDICAILENKITNIFSHINVNNSDPVSFGSIVDEVVQDKVDNPVDQLGIPTGFPIWDAAIGGGLRKHAIQLIGARTKTGKSVFLKEVSINIARKNIPILYLDTEMQTEDQLIRILASTSEVPINDIETGKFYDNPISKRKIAEASEELKQLKSAFKHKVIAGDALDSHLAVMKKWLIQDVGLTKEGKANDCVIVYDYFKLMDSTGLNNLQEYQQLGFMLSKLHNFCVHYDVPMIAAIQLNRVGQNVEDTSAVSQSDRIAWLCSSFSILKNKSPEEIAEEERMHGNQKLIPVISRYGPCLNEGDYIDINFKREIVKMEELGTTLHKRKSAIREKKEQNEFVIKDLEQPVKF